MGSPYQLEIESARTGKPVDTLIDEALQANKTKVGAARQLNISPQALALHLARRERQRLERTAHKTETA